MTSPKALARWRWLHEWSSLICTVFLLMLCVTGLPLIFHEEIDQWLTPETAPPAHSQPAAPIDLDRVLALAREARPGRAVQFVVWLDQPGQFRVSQARNAQAGEKPFVLVDGLHERVTGEAFSEKDWRNGGFMSVLLMLHTNLLMGQAAQLFLGAMGLLLALSLISGAVVYGPYMRRLRFGSVRRDKSTRLTWLDLHNLLGIATLMWLLVVGLTGTVNTLDSIVFSAWQKRVVHQLALDPGRPALPNPQGLQHAVDQARAHMPGRAISFVAFPGHMFATPQHYAIYLKGQSKLTERMLHPVFVDVHTGVLQDVGRPPWYLWALELSRPLHFGDYGGLPLKIIWAALDMLAIVVLGSGLYLWLNRRRKRREQRA